MGLKRNFYYSTILTLSGYIFPLLTYPYVSRVLGLSNVGIVNFVDSLINYFSIFAMMGIAAVGVREIAGNRCDKNKLSSTFWGLLTLNGITTFIAIIILVGAMYSIPSLFPYRDLLYVGVCKLIFNLFLVEWFFTGLEDFAYITRRTLLIKVIYLILVFCMVKEQIDYKIYYMLTVGSVCFNSLVNMVYVRRKLLLNISEMVIKPYLSTFIVIGIYMLITSVYTSLNPVWLGFVTDTDQVGYYTTATKLHAILIAVLGAFSNVMFPRASLLLAENKVEEYWDKIRMSVNALFAFSFPMIALFMVCGPNILEFLVGKGFEGSYLPLRIIVPLILIIGYEQIVIIQMVMAMKKDKMVLVFSIVGALTAIILNLLLVSNLKAIGSALVWLTSESIILMLALSYAIKKLKYSFPMQIFGRYLLFYLPLSLLLWFSIHNIDTSNILVVLIVGAIIFSYTLIIQIKFIKDDIVLSMLRKLTYNK